MTFIDPSAQPLSHRQRRILHKAQQSATAQRALIEASNMTTIAALSTRAYAKLVSNLTRYGNVLSERHSAALMRMVGGYSLLATRRTTGRYAFPLDTGCGKTQSLVAWCAAVHELRLPFSVAIAASKVEALCDLQRDLISNGVDPNKIGLWHSYRHEPDKVAAARQGNAPGFASEPATDEGIHAGKQFLLVTHSRIRGASELGKLNTYLGKDRDLVVWDESLLVSDHRAISKLDLQSEVAWLAPQLEKLNDRNTDKPTRIEAHRYLSTSMAILEQELSDQEANGRQPQQVRLPTLDATTLDSYAKALTSYPLLDDAPTLLEVSQQPLRVVQAAQGGGAYVAYDVVVPPELKRIAVLDASWPIRQLEQLDSTISTMPGFDGRVKSYSGVTINLLRHGSGRAAVERSFRQLRSDDRKLSLEVAEIVKHTPATEGVLIFTFKARMTAKNPVDITAVLLKDLEAAGIDLTATLPTFDGTPRPRIVILRWGQETTVSEFSYLSNVVFAGVLHRADADLAGAIVGQKGDLLTDVTHQDIVDVKASEVAHSLYQAMSRGSCRVVANGEARPMKVWLPHHDLSVKVLLDKVMPGATWAKWKPIHLSAMTSKTEEVAERVASYLRELPDTVTKMSTRVLKQGANLVNVPRRTFTDALQSVGALAPWSVEGRSLVRLF